MRRFFKNPAITITEYGNTTAPNQAYKSMGHLTEKKQLYAAYSIDLCSEKLIRSKVRKNIHRDIQHKSQHVLVYDTRTKLSHSIQKKKNKGRRLCYRLANKYAT